MTLQEVSYNDLQLNPMTLFGNEWAALAAGTEEESNAMTIAWGQMGSLWELEGHLPPAPVVTVYVRPSRYTHRFMEEQDTFTVNFLGTDRSAKKALGYLGGKTGRDGDKYAPAGVTPAYLDGTVYLAESHLVLFCKKLYKAPILKEGFIDPRIIPSNYPEGDFHTMYVGEITKVLEQR